MYPDITSNSHMISIHEYLLKQKLGVICDVKPSVATVLHIHAADFST